MAAVYDVSEIRRCARKISGVANDLSDDINREFNNMHSELYPQFRGQTANAVQEMMNMLRSDGNGLVSNLRSIASQLEAFASRLEAADREAKRQVQASRG